MVEVHKQIPETAFEGRAEVVVPKRDSFDALEQYKREVASKVREAQERVQSLNEVLKHIHDFNEKSFPKLQTIILEYYRANPDGALEQEVADAIRPLMEKLRAIVGEYQKQRSFLRDVLGVQVVHDLGNLANVTVYAEIALDEQLLQDYKMTVDVWPTFSLVFEDLLLCTKERVSDASQYIDEQDPAVEVQKAGILMKEGDSKKIFTRADIEHAKQLAYPDLYTALLQAKDSARDRYSIDTQLIRDAIQSTVDKQRVYSATQPSWEMAQLKDVVSIDADPQKNQLRPDEEVLGNSGTLANSLCNILRNAVRAYAMRVPKKQDRVMGSVVFSVERKGSELVYTVKDKGTGISPELLDPHADTYLYKRGASGAGSSGIGLANMPERLGQFGDIRILSRPYGETGDFIDHTTQRKAGGIVSETHTVNPESVEGDWQTLFEIHLPITTKK